MLHMKQMKNCPKSSLRNSKKKKIIKKKTIGILGLTFKPDSDDTRGSLSLKLLKILKKRGFNCLYSDPYYKLKNNISEKALIYKSDIIIIGTNHKRYKRYKISRNKKLIDLAGFVLK